MFGRAVRDAVIAALPIDAFAFRDSPTAPLKFVLTPGEDVKPGDLITVDRQTGRVRKWRECDGQKFVVPLGSRVTGEGYLEMPR